MPAFIALSSESPVIDRPATVPPDMLTVPAAVPAAFPDGRSTQRDHPASQEFVPRHGIETEIYLPGCDSLRAPSGQKVKGLRDVKIAPGNFALFQRLIEHLIEWNVRQIAMYLKDCSILADGRSVKPVVGD